jgi:hypothetical protein
LIDDDRRRQGGGVRRVLVVPPHVGGATKVDRKSYGCDQQEESERAYHDGLPTLAPQPAALEARRVLEFH